ACAPARRLPDGLAGGRARLPDERRDRELAAALPVRRPVRPVDGLPRLHPQPGQGAARRGPVDRGRSEARDCADGGGRRTEDAVRLAITRTAGTVTSAALIMVAVFALFASLSLIMMQQMGFGLAVAVLIDATVVRAVLLPAAVKVLR